MNKVILIGNVGSELKIHTFEDGNKQATFSLATSISYKSKQTGEKVTKTEWHNIVSINTKQAEVIEKYVAKGSKIAIDGTLIYTKDNSEPPRKFAKIKALSLHFLSNAQKGSDVQSGEDASPVKDDLPF